VGVEPFDADEYDRDVVIPDIALNPNERGVAVCVINTQAVPRTFYVSLAHHCVSGDGTPLQMGWTRDEQVRRHHGALSQSHQLKEHRTSTGHPR
jgi:hypothetical protein